MSREVIMEDSERIWDEACKEAGPVPSFQPAHVAEALNLLLHMIRVLSDGGRPSADDMGIVQEQIDQIKRSR